METNVDAHHIDDDDDPAHLEPKRVKHTAKVNLPFYTLVVGKKDKA